MPGGGGVKIQTSGKYKDPNVCPQMCVLWFTTQKPPSEIPADDGGMKTRRSYISMPFTFTDMLDPDPDKNEKLGTPDNVDHMAELKPEIDYRVKDDTNGRWAALPKHEQCELIATRRSSRNVCARWTLHLSIARCLAEGPRKQRGPLPW